MPEWKRRLVTIEVQFEVDGSQTEGEAVDEAVKPVEAIPRAKILSVQVASR